jgi:hypothetical protein
MERFECEFCEKTFASKKVLKKHLLVAKFCLKQRIEKSNIQCDCGEKFLEIVLLEQHQNLCIVHKNKTIEELRKDKCDIAAERDELRKDICDIKMLKEQLREMAAERDKLLKIVEKAALKPTSTSTSNTTNNINTLNISFPLNLSRAHFDEKAHFIDRSVVANGQVGIADFFLRHIATNESGDVGVVCTDMNRKIFKYMDCYGNIIPDTKAKKIICALEESECGKRMRKVTEDITVYVESLEDMYDKFAWSGIQKKVREQLYYGMGKTFVDRLAQTTYQKGVVGGKHIEPQPKTLEQNNEKVADDDEE